MKIHANPGDIHVFTGQPIITYITNCAECDERLRVGQREFVTQTARDIWAASHLDGMGHHVARSMWVVARND